MMQEDISVSGSWIDLNIFQFYSILLWFKEQVSVCHYLLHWKKKKKTRPLCWGEALFGYHRFQMEKKALGLRSWHSQEIDSGLKVLWHIIERKEPHTRRGTKQIIRNTLPTKQPVLPIFH